MHAARRLAVPLAAALVVAAAVASVAVAASNPETDKSLGPSATQGHFLGYPSPTYQWHGCKKEDTQWWPTSLVSGNPTTSPSTHRYVTFTVNTKAYPMVSWKAKAGYRICGVEVATQLTSPQVRGSDLLAEASYTSGPTQGTTALNGRETIKVRIPTKGIDQAGFEEFEGKTFTMFAFQAVTVFVKKG